MPYSVKLLGKTHELPTKTIATAKQLERFAELPTLYSAKKVTIEEIVAEQYSFLATCVGEETAQNIAGGEMENADIDAVSFAVMDIVKAYTEEALKRQLQAQVAQVKNMLADKDIAKAVDVVSKVR